MATVKTRKKYILAALALEIIVLLGLVTYIYRDLVFSIHEKAELGNLTLLRLHLFLKPDDLNARYDSPSHWRFRDGYTPLHFAAGKGRLEAARFLIKRGADVNARPKEGKGATPLSLATGIIRHNDKEDYYQTARLLIDRGAEISPGDLFNPAFYGYAATVQLLIDNGADVNAIGPRGVTPLFKAAWTCEREVVKILVNAGADVNACSKIDTTPLHEAVRNVMDYEECADAARFLLENGAAIDVFLAAGLGDAESLSSMIHGNRQLVNEIGVYGWTPLHWAARGDMINTAGFLIESGADVNAKDYQEESPIHTAARAGSVRVVKLLLEHGADINSRTREGFTPLHYAALNDRKEVCRLLVEKGSEMEARLTAVGMTPLHLAARKGHEEILSLLIEKGADLEARDETGWTPLHAAACSGRKNAVNILLRLGADLEAKDNEGNRPEALAWKCYEPLMAWSLFREGF